MDYTDRLPWQDDYKFIMEERRLAEKELEDLENPEKQLRRIKQFFQDLGADYSKNSWVTKAESDINAINKGENSRLNLAKKAVNFGNALENAVQNQDDDSIRSLINFRGDERYGSLITEVMFYLGVTKSKTEREQAKRAYKAIHDRYTFDKITPFNKEGVFYYLYYYECLRSLIHATGRGNDKNDIYDYIKYRCTNDRLMFNEYLSDIYISNSVTQIMDEISKVEMDLNKQTSS